MGPLTGDAAFVGKEQLGFARYAIRKLAAGKIRLDAVDTQLDPRRAATVAAGFRRDARVLAVVGPATNKEVLAVAPTFKRTPQLVFVSASALNSALTNGSIPTFFRVVPNDDAQAPSTARYIRRSLKAKNVAVVDDKSSYSKGLADSVQTALRAAGVRVTRRSVSQKATEFTSLVASIADGVDVVYLPWQIAANGQIFGQQLREQGKQAVVFGGDGLDSGDFKIPGSYVAAFAPDVRAVKGNETFVREYGARFGSNFGPPAYVATQAAIVAIQKACADGRGHAQGGTQHHEGDPDPEHRPRRRPPVHRPRRPQGRRVLDLQARCPRQEDPGGLDPAPSCVNFLTFTPYRRLQGGRARRGSVDMTHASLCDWQAAGMHAPRCATRRR